MSAVFKEDPFVVFDGAALAIRASSYSAALSSSRAARGPVIASGEAPSAAPRVLVVEPDESSRSVMQVALAREGFDVLALSSAEEALRQLGPGRRLPEVIVA